MRTLLLSDGSRKRAGGFPGRIHADFSEFWAGRAVLTGSGGYVLRAQCVTFSRRRRLACLDSELAGVAPVLEELHVGGVVVAVEAEGRSVAGQGALGDVVGKQIRRAVGRHHAVA